VTLFETPAVSRPRCKLVLAYDGTAFHGYAAQPEVRTVEGELIGALERLLRSQPVNLACAGRTDSGVHAWGQVVSFDVAPELEPDRVRDAMNGMLAPEIVVREAVVAAPDFDARRSARWRHYRYTIVNRPSPDPFLARYAWWIAAPVDLHALHLAADPFVGEHDFAAFCRRGAEGSTSVRRVVESRWKDLGDGVLQYEIRANAFCWQMVRSIVGTLVEAGTGKRRPGEITSILRSRDRAHAGAVAPPHGLCLWEVGY
jgi:tRNA pseudouridine38-40 synthase